MLRCAEAPCKSCPYRRDVPSGIWARSEYERLPSFDGEILDQLFNAAFNVFLCHQQDGKLCAGWIGTHGANNLLACRFGSERLHPSVWRYVSPVPLFASGEEAARHGLRRIRRPDRNAQRVIARLSRRLHGSDR